MKCPQMAQMGPGGFFLINPDLRDIWGRPDFDFENFYFWDLLELKFPDFQVPDFHISRNLAWAQLGPKLGPWWDLAAIHPWLKVLT